MDDKRPPLQLELVELGTSETSPALGPPRHGPGALTGARDLLGRLVAWWHARPPVGKRVVAPLVATLWQLVAFFLDPITITGVLVFLLAEWATQITRQAGMPYRGAKNRLSYLFAFVHVAQHVGIGVGMCEVVMDICMMGVKGSSGIDACADNSIVMGYILFPIYYASCGFYLAFRQLGCQRCSSMTAASGVRKAAAP